jgi:NAD(P)-dependent dehydrogenase (short-subunit alcohol dehydrogenase family)
MDLGLEGRVALVTGGGAGFGAAIAHALAAEGCRLLVADRDAAAAGKTAQAVQAAGADATPLTLDVADEAAVSAAFAPFDGKTRRLDILVNCAGLLSTGPVADLPVGEWDRIARVNITGVLSCSKAAIPAMIAQHHGRIINIASVSAMRGGGSVGNTLYGAAKAAVAAITMGLARELGPHGVTVNAVAPAIAETAMTRAALTEDARRRILARIPLGRLAEATDIAALVTFLVSDRAAFMTGTVIPVDGGILTT